MESVVATLSKYSEMSTKKGYQNGQRTAFQELCGKAGITATVLHTVPPHSRRLDLGIPNNAELRPSMSSTLFLVAQHSPAGALIQISGPKSPTRRPASFIRTQSVHYLEFSTILRCRCATIDSFKHNLDEALKSLKFRHSYKLTKQGQIVTFI
ncbi:unnamed protein product [Echinostoma caproni]|uniref:Integrase catalytic domain-containing protein n=1 Tax=Echinostoma caproni TaxID=27848 RepID=A0A183B0D0_9TREM|nr:unnamed protein product [Echinostoma caproni]